MRRRRLGPKLPDNVSIEEAYQLLAGAILDRAVKDYTLALKAQKSGRSKSWDIDTLEKFFRGEWFMALTNGNIDGEYVITEVRKKCRTSRST